MTRKFTLVRKGKPMTMQEYLEQSGYDTFAYSGRGMFGKQCVAISIDTVGELFLIGASVGHDVLRYNDAPKIDNLGKGFVAYWPNHTYTVQDLDDMMERNYHS